MKRRKESPTVTPAYLAGWLRLLARSPAELEEQRQSRQPAPAPRTPHAQQGPKSAPEATQSTGVLPVPHLPKKAKPEPPLTVAKHP